jgi:hypothetical protein
MTPEREPEQHLTAMRKFARLHLKKLKSVFDRFFEENDTPTRHDEERFENLVQKLRGTIHEICRLKQTP